MWEPLSWTIQHRVGLFHGFSHTVLVLIAWYAHAVYRFVAVYLVTIAVRENRWRQVNARSTPSRRLS